MKRLIGSMALIALTACGGTSRRNDGMQVKDPEHPTATGGSESGAGGRGGKPTTTTGGSEMYDGGAPASAGTEAGGHPSAGTSGFGGMTPAGGLPGSGATGGTSDKPEYFPETGGIGYCGAEGGCVVDIPSVPAVEPPGPVLCGGLACPTPKACCLTDSHCYDPATNPDSCPEPPADSDLWGRPTCSSNAQCPARTVCWLETGLCQGIGHCQPIGNTGACGPGDFCHTCGCDGNSYPDYQTAARAGTSTPSTWGGSCGSLVQVDAQTSRRLCGKTEDCMTGESCCAITAACYPSDKPALCRMPPDGKSYPCLSNAQCVASEYCAAQGCDTPGFCAPLGPQEECGVTIEPTCGCDGKTYTSPPCAEYKGIRVAHAGACN